MDSRIRPPVMIFGDSITALGVIKGIKELDQVDVYIVSSDGSGSARHSRFVKETIVISNNDKNYIDKVIDFINKTLEVKPVLMVAGNDTALEVLSKSHELLSEYSIPTFPSWVIVGKAINKEVTYEVAGSLGIPTMETQKIENKSELNEYLATANNAYPKFLKSTYSREFLAKFKTKGVICHNREDIECAYEKYEGFCGSLLVQPFLSGDIDQVTAVLLVISPSGDLLSVTVNEKVRSSFLYGSTSLSRSIWNLNLAERAVKLAKHIGYYGIVGVQFKFDPKLNDFRFLEVNGRFSVSTPIAQKCGHNLPEITYLTSIGKKLEKVTALEKTYPENVLLWLPLDDVRILFQKRFYKNPVEFIKPLLSRRFVLMPLSISDPLPTLADLSTKLLGVVRLIYRKLSSW